MHMQNMPKSGHKAPARAGADGKSAVGKESKADMAGAGVMGGSHTLSDAVKHLAKEHPQKYDDLGPHHTSRR